MSLQTSFSIDEDAPTQLVDFVPSPTTNKSDEAFGIICYKNSKNGIEYALVQNNDQEWGLPKGYPESEDNKSSWETAVRETKEEAGIDEKQLMIGCIAHDKMYSATYFNKKKLTYKITKFFVRQVSVELDLSLPSENHPEILARGFYSFEQACDMIPEQHDTRNVLMHVHNDIITNNSNNHNIIRCLMCNKLLRSTRKHDLVECGCPNNTFCDGGDEYIRCGGNDINIVEIVSERYP